MAVLSTNPYWLGNAAHAVQAVHGPRRTPKTLTFRPAHQTVCILLEYIHYIHTYTALCRQSCMLMRAARSLLLHFPQNSRSVHDSAWPTRLFLELLHIGIDYVDSINQLVRERTTYLRSSAVIPCMPIKLVRTVLIV